MAQKREYNLKDLFSIILVCLLIFLIYILPGDPGPPGFQGRKVLLQQTDFHELLKAGRELISKAEGKEYVDKYSGQIRRDLFIPKDVNIPDAIIELRQKLSGLGLANPMNIYNHGVLMITFNDRVMGLFSVNIYPDDFKEPKEYYKYGDKMLIPGLWYCDDRYEEYGPKYGKIINKMIKKNQFLKKR